MSSVILNRGNTDVVTLDIEQTGSAKSEVMTEEPLLDNSRDHMIAVTQLSAPLDLEPMITYNVLTSLLFTVNRRAYGEQKNTAGTQLVFGATHAGKESLSIPMNYKIFSFSDLLALVAQWCAGLSQAIADTGLRLGGANPTRLLVNENVAPNNAAIDYRAQNGVRLLATSVTSTGTFKFVGAGILWDNFYISVTPYAQTLFGLPDEIAFSDLGDGGEVTEVLLDANDLIDQPITPLLVGDIYQFLGEYPVTRFLDERIHLTCEISLPLPWNVVIQNGKESRSHQIGTFPIMSPSTTTVTVNNGVLQTGCQLTMESKVGRVHFLQNTEQTTQWYPLQSSVDIQTARVELYMTRRRYVNGGWSIQKRPLLVDKDSLWSATFKFVTVY